MSAHCACDCQRLLVFAVDPLSCHVCRSWVQELFLWMLVLYKMYVCVNTFRRETQHWLLCVGMSSTIRYAQPRFLISLKHCWHYTNTQIEAVWNPPAHFCLCSWLRMAIQLATTKRLLQFGVGIELLDVSACLCMSVCV